MRIFAYDRFKPGVTLEQIAEEVRRRHLTAYPLDGIPLAHRTLPVGGVQGRGQPCPQPLAQRVLGDQPLEVGDGGVGLAEGEQRVAAPFAVLEKPAPSTLCAAQHSEVAASVGP